jgi:hypothetical protein
MNEPRSVPISANPAPFVGSLVGKRMASFSDGRPGTNNGRSCPGVVFLDAPEQQNRRSCPGGFLFKKEQDDGRDSGRTHPFIGCVSVRPFSPSPPG